MNSEPIKIAAKAKSDSRRSLFIAGSVGFHVVVLGGIFYSMSGPASPKPAVAAPPSASIALTKPPVTATPPKPVAIAVSKPSSPLANRDQTKPVIHAPLGIKPAAATKPAVPPTKPSVTASLTPTAVKPPVKPASSHTVKPVAVAPAPSHGTTTRPIAKPAVSQPHAPPKPPRRVIAARPKPAADPIKGILTRLDDVPASKPTPAPTAVDPLSDLTERLKSE